MQLLMTQWDFGQLQEYEDTFKQKLIKPKHSHKQQQQQKGNFSEDNNNIFNKIVIIISVIFPKSSNNKSFQ